MFARVADDRNSSAFAMVVPVMFFTLAYTYAIAVNFIPNYRDSADNIGKSETGTTTSNESGVKGDEKDRWVVGERRASSNTGIRPHEG